MFIVGYGRRTPYEHNIGYLKRYTPQHCRLTVMNTVRASGYEERKPHLRRKRGDANAGKLESSLSRSRRNIWELSMCNMWEYFVTLTVNGEKMNRYDLNAVYKKLGKWFNNYNSRNATSIKYLIIPEQHKDGAWHFHCLLHGLPLEHLRPFQPADHIPQHIKEMLVSGRIIYEWPAYREIFGFVTVEAILHPDRCAAYMTKYITKELMESVIDLNAHIFFCSQHLNRAELVCRGPVVKGIEQPDFENEHVHIKNFKTPEEAMPYFNNEEKSTWKKQS